MRCRLPHALALLGAITLATAQAAPAPPPASTASDTTAILAMLRGNNDELPASRVSPDLDWENAFGIRYTSLKKRDAFYGAVVTPLQQHDTDTTLEAKVKLITPDVAVADQYWHVVGQLDINTHKPGPDRWGRTTYVFKRQSGQWIEVLERVADLRYAYYHHYDALPKPIAVPAATLAAYAGTYEFIDDHKQRIIAVDHDHLTFASPKRTRIAIPVSATDFLLFDPDDLAEYNKLHFSTDPKSGTRITIADEIGEVGGTLGKLR
jgi:hypothetical protein